MSALAGLEGLRSGLRSSLRSSLRPPLRPSGPARADTPANFKANREKLQDTQQKVRDTQPNPCYSAKNNVAIRTISTFMSTPLKHRTPSALYNKVRNALHHPTRYIFRVTGELAQRQNLGLKSLVAKPLHIHPPQHN